MTDFREIDTAGFRPAQLRDQAQPQLIWAPVADLVIDTRYQRELTMRGRKMIQRIADNWDWTKYTPIQIAPAENGRLAVVDGQHRAHAAAVVGLASLPAMVVPMTLAQAAGAFAAVNKDRTNVSAHHIYRAALMQGEEWAVKVRDAVEAAGCEVAGGNASSASRVPGRIYCVVEMRKRIDAGEAEAVTAGLAAIRQSEAGENAAAYDYRVLRLWIAAIATSQRFLRLPLAELFDAIDVEAIIDEARAAAKRGAGQYLTLARDRIAAELRAALEEEK